ncbi:hypothetical protein C8A05DRAFT_20649 [Staphylotrichum tortipilum]|uniref:Uncharacterized protein n=1 Tax=Staphylotrichum tortipilum TaxID=2831512 RepID=A0AAN6M978_9PEZI|nr:hypothetical protein C8A05DRAFT_20649 [Staphylotrichum longicolle]
MTCHPALSPFVTHALPPARIPALGFTHRPFTSSPPRPNQPAEPESLSLSPHDPPSLTANSKPNPKWGFLVFRTSYASEFDGGWADMKRYTERMRSSLPPRYDAETMDFVFIEDPTLEGAEIAELQRRFRAWATEDSGGVDFENSQVLAEARYRYFLRVDGEGLWGGWVGLNEGWELEDEGEEWMKVMRSSIGLEMYGQLCDPVGWDNWWSYYTPPRSGVSNW